MTSLDWILVVGINGAIVLYGLLIAKGTRRSVDWFLAAKGLPWWMVGLSMFATAVDSGDYVAVVGGSYHFGLSNLTTWWLGLPIGWFLVAYLVLIPLYRSGMFTNAEYLEYRFGPTVRVLSAFIQLQYRTNVLGNIAFSLFLTFSILTGWGESTWWLVGSIALAAALYTATGGLKAVAVTDALQSGVMVIASVLLWLIVWDEVGGWAGLEAKLAASDPDLPDTMLHVGGENREGVPPPLMIFGWIVVLSSYCVVNQSQAMRMLAARSEWDLKTAALLASVVTVIVMWFNITLGILGRGLMPDLVIEDEVFPRLVQQFVAPGLIGLVVAGLLAGGISTFDSIGSALAAVFTRDIYARFFVKDRGDRHYLRVSRWMTVVVIAMSFLYVPFLKEGMLVFYLRLTTVAVMPLFTVYLMGALTRVHRKAGAVGLAAGILYGLSSFLGERFEWPLPDWWTNKWWAYLWSILVTSTAMVVVSLIQGWERKDEIRALMYSARAPYDPAEPGVRAVPSRAQTWLERTRREASRLRPDVSYPVERRPWYRSPFFWSCLFIAVVGFINLVVLW